MSKNKYIIVSYFLALLFTGIIITYSLIQRKTIANREKIQFFISSNFNNKNIHSYKYIFADSSSLYCQISNEFIKKCPDSSVFNYFFKKGQNKTDGLWFFFHFVFNSYFNLAVSSTYIIPENNYIKLKMTFSCSKKFEISIYFLDKNDHLLITKIIGVTDFSEYLCPLLN